MRILIALLTALFCHGTVGAQGLTRVMSGYAAISGPHAVLWGAREAGLFEAHGCGVHPKWFDYGSNTSFRRDSIGADGRPCRAGGRCGGHGRELCSGGAE